MKKKQYKTAIGYARVSTEDQGKGTSLESQMDSIELFCKNNNITLIKVFKDKASGKDFNRPQYQKSLDFLRENRGEIDLFLTKKIDRFTRNTKTALEEIDKITKLGVEVNFVDDWLEDITSAGGEMMRDIKIVFASQERRGIDERCRLGERTALRGGRYFRRAPKGYVNQDLPNGKPCIAPGPDASLVKQLFEDYSTGQYAQADLIKRYKYKGLTLSKSALSRMLSNVLYMGYIDLKEANIEPYTLIKGLHTPIISEELFYKAQAIKSGKNRMVKKVRPKNEKFPLSGFILCPVCGSPVYGSTSNNGSKKKVRRYYNNYKCSCNCPAQSYKAETVHEILLKELAKIKPSEEVLILFKAILLDTYKEAVKDIEGVKKGIDRQIAEIEKNKMKLVEKFIEDKIAEEQYKMLLNKYESEYSILKIEKAKYGSHNEDLEKYLSFGISLLANLDIYYNRSSIDTKVKLLGSYFTEKLVFENGKFRTLPFNEIIRLISKYTKDLRSLKKESGRSFLKTSHSVLGAEALFISYLRF